MKKLFALLIALSVAACSTGGTERKIGTFEPEMRLADVTDMGSTAAFLIAEKGVELNPILQDLSTAETVAGVFVLKVAARAGINAIPATDLERENLHVWLSGIGYGATLNNILLFTSVSNPAFYGVLTALGYTAYNTQQNKEKFDG